MMKYAIIILLTAMLTTTQAFGAAFRNLDFDSGDTNGLIMHPEIHSSDPPTHDVGTGEISDLLPGWQITLGGSAYHDLFWLNLNPIGGGLISLYDHYNIYYSSSAHIPVQGKFSFAMLGDPNSQPATLFSLFQTGDVPGDARSIRFLNVGREVQLFLNGTEVPVNYTYGPATSIYPDTRLSAAEADVSAFAGQTVELKFVGLPTFGTGASLSGLDSIEFSPIPVPEPGTIALLSFGLFALGIAAQRSARARRWRSK